MSLPDEPVPLEADLWATVLTNPLAASVLLGAPLGIVCLLALDLLAALGLGPQFALLQMPWWWRTLGGWFAGSVVVFFQLSKPY
jgi:hypothetical protein